MRSRTAVSAICTSRTTRLRICASLVPSGSSVSRRVRRTIRSLPRTRSSRRCTARTRATASCRRTAPPSTSGGSMADVVFNDVDKIYDNGFHAVQDLSLDIKDGEFLVLVGPSGCGKTTALRMVAGLEEISDGELFIGDRVVNQLTPKERDVAMVFQNYALYPHLSVYENIAFGLRLRKESKDEVHRRVSWAAKMLDLTPYLDRKPKQLSGGQRQRVAMGRAIVRQPQGFLMDEPLSNLDAALRVQTRAEILRLQQRLGTTTIYVTHDQIEAMTMGDRIAVMNKGELQQLGTPEELYERPANTFVAQFIGSPAMNMLPSAVLGVGGTGQLAGFRPEHVRLGNGRAGAHSYDASVEVVEYLGDEQLAHLRLGDHEIVVKLPVEPRLRAGEHETIS